MTYDLHSRCPYTEAALMETMRVTPMAALGQAHLTTEDVDFRGYHIPKDTEVQSNPDITRYFMSMLLKVGVPWRARQGGTWAARCEFIFGHCMPLAVVMLESLSF